MPMVSDRILNLTRVLLKLIKVRDRLTPNRTCGVITIDEREIIRSDEHLEATRDRGELARLFCGDHSILMERLRRARRAP